MPSPGLAPPAAALSRVDRFLPLWIGVAMLAGVVGPLIEEPVQIGLVPVALWIGRRWFGDRDVDGHPVAALRPVETPVGA